MPGFLNLSASLYQKDLFSFAKQCKPQRIHKKAIQIDVENDIQEKLLM